MTKTRMLVVTVEGAEHHTDHDLQLEVLLAVEKWPVFGATKVKVEGPITIPDGISLGITSDARPSGKEDVRVFTLELVGGSRYTDKELSDRITLELREALRLDSLDGVVSDLQVLPPARPAKEEKKPEMETVWKCATCGGVWKYEKTVASACVNCGRSAHCRDDLVERPILDARPVVDVIAAKAKETKSIINFAVKAARIEGMGDAAVTDIQEKMKTAFTWAFEMGKRDSDARPVVNNEDEERWKNLAVCYIMDNIRPWVAKKADKDALREALRECVGRTAQRARSVQPSMLMKDIAARTAVELDLRQRHGRWMEHERVDRIAEVIAGCLSESAGPRPVEKRRMVGTDEEFVSGRGRPESDARPSGEEKKTDLPPEPFAPPAPPPAEPKRWFKGEEEVNDHLRKVRSGLNWLDEMGYDDPKQWRALRQIVLWLHASIAELASRADGGTQSNSTIVTKWDGALWEAAEKVITAFTFAIWKENEAPYTLKGAVKVMEKLMDTRADVVGKPEGKSVWDSDLTNAAMALIEAGTTYRDCFTNPTRNDNKVVELGDELEQLLRTKGKID